MTNGEARVLETEVVIFTAETNQENRQNDEVAEVSEVKFVEATNKFDIKYRFARLKKSLRKRSVSIL